MRPAISPPRTIVRKFRHIDLHVKRIRVCRAPISCDLIRLAGAHKIFDILVFKAQSAREFARAFWLISRNIFPSVFGCVRRKMEGAFSLNLRELPRSFSRATCSAYLSVTYALLLRMTHVSYYRDALLVSLT